MHINLEVVALRAIGVVLAVPLPRETPAGRERSCGIVAEEAVCKKNPVGSLRRLGSNQQVNIAHIANAGIAEDGLRQGDSLEHSDRNARLLQQIA